MSWKIVYSLRKQLSIKYQSFICKAAVNKKGLFIWKAAVSSETAVAELDQLPVLLFAALDDLGAGRSVIAEADLLQVLPDALRILRTQVHTGCTYRP